MKILMATMGLDIGGAETHIVELAKALRHQGHEVMIVSNGGVYVPEINAAGIRHYQAPLHRRSFAEMRRARGILEDVIRKERPDVVHAHARIPAFLCGTLKEKLGFAFVTSCHGVYRVSGALRMLSDWGERTLAVSEDIRDYLMEEYHIPEEQIALTINGIDTDKFSNDISGESVRREFGLGDGLVIGHVSRLDRETSLAADQLIEIAPALDQKYPGIRLLLVGGGTAFAELKAKAAGVNQKLGRECLTLTGPRTDVNLMVAASDVFVGVSRAALEAMAACKPVVLSGAQGHTGIFTPELLEKAVDTNFCCRTDPTATPEQLFGDVVSLLERSQEEKRALGEYGRTVVQQYYSVDRMARDCINMYQKVLRSNYRVLMSGYYGFSNVGDDAILESVKQAMERSGAPVELTVLSHDPELTRRQYGLKAVDRFDPGKVFSALKETDLLLFGGGSLLQDVTSNRSLLYYLSIIRLAQLMGKPVMLYANGIGPVKQKINREMVKHTVERSAVVTLRDHGSIQLLKELGVTSPELHMTADPVFHLEPVDVKQAKQALKKCGLPEGREFVAVSVRDWSNAERFPAQLAQLCDYLRCTYDVEILFLLMQPSNDSAVTQKVQSLMQEPSYMLSDYRGPSELLGVMGQARLCLAMRLHTLIFAARMVVPAMGMVYDPKVDSYLKELGLQAAGHVEHFDVEVAKARADDVMKHYDEVRASLGERSRQMSVAAKENERLLLELLERTRNQKK